MKNTLLNSLLILFTICASTLYVKAQDGSAKATEKEKEDKQVVRFNGLGRTNLSQTAITGDVVDNDTTTIRSLTDGEFLLDLAVNATPNEKTEVQSILRLRNEFGGFFGAGMSIEVRELWARGIIANAIKYRVGDMDVKMTPYTLFLAQEEGRINEPAAFFPQREVIYYEQFYTGENTRRLQGGKFDFGLEFNQGLRDLDASVFIARIRGTDFFTTPTRFISGAQLQLNTVKFVESTGTQLKLGLNAVSTFDDLKSGQATAGIRNNVFTADYDLTAYDNDKMGIHIVGESGLSRLMSKDDSVTFFTTDDVFVDVGVQLNLKPQKVTVLASFIDVGPDFFSIGAQSKRVEFDATKSFYNRIGTNDILRQSSIFDLTRDRGQYTFRLSDQLMAYDPRFANTMPYGTATPNRRGLRSKINYGQVEDAINAEVNTALLSEIRGQGTEELKNFMLLRGAVNFNIHDFIDWENRLKVTLGYQYENTSRGGVEVEKVDLTSNILEAGVESEIFANFDLMLGMKYLTANGSEYIPRVDEFNVIRDFPTRTIFDDEEALYAGGIKYTFKKGIYLTIQYQTFGSRMGQNNPNDYGFDQIFALYTMNF